MADGRRRVRVFVTFGALHDGIDAYSVASLDLIYAREVLGKQREKIEAAASK
jgi:hypothetical protein